MIARTVLRASESAAPLTFEVALRMRSFDELQARIANGERVSPAEKEEKYFPLAADHDKLVTWLKAQGLEVTRTDDNRLAVFGRGSVDAVAKAFQVTFARVTATDGLEFTSAITAPSVPAELSSAVLGIHGLQPHIRRRPLSAPWVLSPRINLSGYTPAQILTAYKADTLGVTGAGQTIAIYALGYPASSDLTQFWQTTTSGAQTVSNVQQVNVAGGPESSPAADILEEATLDVEWAGGLAPGAKIRIYGANATDPADNDEILQQVYADIPSNPTMHVLSISVGGNESDVPKDYLIMEGQYMANLASAGVTVLVASGDTGATAENIVQTTYPTSDPDVTGVGGTSLTLTGGNAISTEVAWTSSGGGVSKVFSRPTWQVGTGVPSGSMRLVPDVASVSRSRHRRYVLLWGQVLSDWGNQLVRPDVGRIGRAHQPEDRDGAGFDEPEALPAARNLGIQRHHLGQQRGVLRWGGL
jgi:kumamolisin